MIKGKETIAIERKIWSDKDSVYGNPKFTIETIVLTGCLVAWGSSGEQNDLFGVTSETQATLQLPYNTPVKDNDVFILSNGHRYVQQGPAIQWVGQVGNPIRQKKLVNVVFKEGGSDA